MSKLLASKITKIDKNKVLTNPKGRNVIGIIASVISVICNTFLGIVKVSIGAIFNSIAVITDGLNNITDTTSSFVSMIGFKMSNKPADKEHPFGHRRVEYISAMIISIIITALGIELLITSIERIIEKEITEFTTLSMYILAFSIVVKLILFFYNYSYSKKINSKALKNLAIDCLNDVFTTSVVLISSIVGYITKVDIDSYAGLIVSLFIMTQGIRLLLETCSPLLGEKADIKIVKELVTKVKSYDGILGVHDVIIHNYGPNKYFATLHAEVDSSMDIGVSHEIIDNIERELSNENLHLVIHLDPLNTKDEYVKECQLLVNNVIKQIDKGLSIHDFRMVTGENLVRFLFDILAPYDFKLDDGELVSEVCKRLKEINPIYDCIINVDHNYIG